MNEINKRWGMTIDVNRCVGCQTCTVACKHANDTVPGVQWRKVLDVETGKYPDVERVFMVVGCQHCAEPSCVPVCPTGATKQREDGLVTMDYDLCIGCASCAVACPYQARTIVHDKPWYFGVETAQEAYVAHDERVGVAQKCTFCIDRVDDGLEAGLRPGDDPLATPACASSCISQAIKFGDFNDPDSQVSKLTASRDFFQMHEELGNDPQIKYLIETPAVPARTTTDDEHDDEEMLDLEHALVGKRQLFWDMRAAMNFIMGGIGSGTVVMAYLLSFFVTFDSHALININIGAGVILAVGLFFVWLKIGRKLRAPFAILRPHTSWMSREIYAVGLFYLSVAADILQPSPLFHATTALGAALFLYCQGRILHAGKGIPSWRVAQMPIMLVATGLLEGIALLTIIFSKWGDQLPDTLPIPPLAIFLIVLNAYLWRRYNDNAKAWGIGPIDRRILNLITPKLHVIGHVLPLVLFGTLFLNDNAPIWVADIAGFLTIAGGVLWKAVVITRACHMQSFAMGKMPQRGSGKYAAPLKV
ncbi:MAG: dimethyl sulfoxide reductase anchor subunit [Rhodospirillaceae bacterium]|jgi:phenylacetyl-CoA:acceptor oxidoreductase 27-kDa subunit|nr:dimethyl sulfoxide reductase anchor subunit [Rhodospirillaceae bacterium]MBT4587833.1 dimethyl sulfoxide reductase anchor subunit [Rhodospirillaceae bacterium]MBT7267683.1 dimethyl sulfoxide reductase anchor subunit [Rhodospirillaceae bacterium]